MGALALSSPKVSSTKPVERDPRASRKLPSKTAVQTANQIDQREAFQPIIKRNLRIEVASGRTEDVQCILKGLKVRIEYTRGKDNEVDIDSEER